MWNQKKVTGQWVCVAVWNPEQELGKKNPAPLESKIRIEHTKKQTVIFPQTNQSRKTRGRTKFRDTGGKKGD